LPIEVFDQLRAGVQADRSQFWKDLSLPFYGYNRPSAKVSQSVRESFWLQGMMAGFPASYFCIKAGVRTVPYGRMSSASSTRRSSMSAKCQ
jgi:non-heme chloroperoxidase